MTEFKKISSIEVGNEASWQDAIFLTFYIDWAHDKIINNIISLVEHAGVQTYTHDTAPWVTSADKSEIECKPVSIGS